LVDKSPPDIKRAGSKIKCRGGIKRTAVRVSEFDFSQGTGEKAKGKEAASMGSTAGSTTDGFDAPRVHPLKRGHVTPALRSIPILWWLGVMVIWLLLTK
jgi:hypothetical protein